MFDIGFSELLVIGVVALIGAVICFLFALETRGKVLEELAPAR